jgi:hypothetical protein
MFADAAVFAEVPSGVYWRAGADGLIARCFHLHPLLVDPVQRVPLDGTYDDHYLRDACPDFSRVHVVTDSDELQVFELTAEDRAFRALRRPRPPVWQAAMLAARCDELQLRHWRDHPVRLHAGDIGEEWTAPAAEADAFARAVLRRRPYSTAAKRWFRWSEQTAKRTERYVKAARRRTRRVRLDRVRRAGERGLKTMARRRPRIRLKQVQRPARLLLHQAEKFIRLRAKRLRRRVRLLLPV